jgi:hypothetical protein
MNILERIKEFASWDEATQQACIQYASESKKKLSKPSRQSLDRPWSEVDEDRLFELFRRYGLDINRLPEWCEMLNRTESSIKSKWYRKFKKGQK